MPALWAVRSTWILGREYSIARYDPTSLLLYASSANRAVSRYSISTMSAFVLSTNVTTPCLSRSGPLNFSSVAMRCPRNTSQSLLLMRIPA